MIPITKNIIVVDEHGANYGVTYLKRAKGLVKKGRARFIEENKICLACLPNNWEDKDMKSFDMDSTAESSAEEATKAFEENSDPIAAEPIDSGEAKTQKPECSMEYILSSIDKIITDTQHIEEALNALQNLNANGAGDIANASKAEAIGNVVKCRETTNQQLIRLLEKMYDDLKPKEMSPEMLKLQQLTDTLCRYPQDVAADIIRKSAQQMFVEPGAAIVR